MLNKRVKDTKCALVDHLQMNLQRASSMLTTDAINRRKRVDYGYLSGNRKNKELRDILKQIRRDSVELEKLMKMD